MSSNKRYSATTTIFDVIFSTLKQRELMLFAGIPYSNGSILVFCFNILNKDEQDWHIQTFHKF